MAAGTSQITIPPDLIGPDYNIYRYRGDFFKVVRFKTNTVHLRHSLDGQENMEQQPLSEEMQAVVDKQRLSQSLSRTRRVVLELALCNDWKWFVTLTIGKRDRTDLHAYYQKFREFLKYQQEKHGVKIRYLLIPELHSDGMSWHMHGFMGAEMDPFLVSFAQMDRDGYTGPDGKKLPRKLIRKGYYDWPEYSKRFGFCSFGEIRNQTATAFYATKYITKSFQQEARKSGQNLYYASQGLERANYYDSVYGECAALDACLTHDYQFCKTGFYSFQRDPGVDLENVLELLDGQLGSAMAPYRPDTLADMVTPVDPLAPEQEALEYYETMQDILARYS